MTSSGDMENTDSGVQIYHKYYLDSKKNAYRCLVCEALKFNRIEGTRQIAMRRNDESACFNKLTKLTHCLDSNLLPVLNLFMLGNLKAGCIFIPQVAPSSCHQVYSEVTHKAMRPPLSNSQFTQILPLIGYTRDANFSWWNKSKGVHTQTQMTIVRWCLDTKLRDLLPHFSTSLSPRLPPKVITPLTPNHREKTLKFLQINRQANHQWERK